MTQTKNDLCSNAVTLDYLELIKAARVAVKYSLEALRERMRRWYDFKRKPTSLDAEWLLDDATALATATTALYYLEEGLDREEVEVVNKPEVKRED